MPVNTGKQKQYRSLEEYNRIKFAVLTSIIYRVQSKIHKETRKYNPFSKERQLMGTNSDMTQMSDFKAANNPQCKQDTVIINERQDIPW